MVAKALLVSRKPVWSLAMSEPGMPELLRSAALLL